MSCAVLCHMCHPCRLSGCHAYYSYCRNILVDHKTKPASQFFFSAQKLQRLPALSKTRSLTVGGDESRPATTRSGCKLPEKALNPVPRWMPTRTEDPVTLRIQTVSVVPNAAFKRSMTSACVSLLCSSALCSLVSELELELVVPFF